MNRGRKKTILPSKWSLLYVLYVHNMNIEKKIKEWTTLKRFFDELEIIW